MPKKSFKFDLSADITRDQHVRMTCGKTAGPRSWKTEDKRRTERAELSRKLRDALDQVGLSDRRSLAHQFDNFVELINAAVRTKKGFSRTEVAAMMEWHKSMHQVGELLHDESVHVSHIIRVSTDLLKTANLHDEYQSGVDLMFFWPPSLSLESFNQLTGWLKSVRSLEYGSIEQKPSDDVPIIFGLVTNSQKSVERQRETRALPDVAERKRRPIINTVEHYLKCLAPRASGEELYARYLVVTFGPRVGFSEDLNAAFAKFHRKISQWANKSRSRFFVDVLFRATESPLSEDGYHIHANLLVEHQTPNCDLSNEGWIEYVAAMEHHFDARCFDNGRIKIDKIEKLTSYLSKSIRGAELDEHILNHKARPERTKQYFQGMFKSRHIATMGKLNKISTELAAKKLKIAKFKDPKLVKKFNRPPAQRHTPGARPPENLILSVNLPSRLFSPWSEPSILVLGFTRCPRTEAGKVGLSTIESLCARIREIWFLNGGPDPARALSVAAVLREALTDAEIDAAWQLKGESPSSKLVDVTVAPSSVCPEAHNPHPASPTFAENGYLIDAKTGEVLERLDNGPTSTRHDILLRHPQRRDSSW